jgi:hypothetical protein
MEIYDIYVLGRILDYIWRLPVYLRANITIPIYGEKFVISALKEINEILKTNKISKSTQESIKIFIENLITNYPDEIENPNLKIRDAEDLRDDSKIWADRIKHELNNIVIYRAFTDGRLSATKLCDGAKSFFQAKIWKKLTKIIKEDLEESAKCLLTQSWTASGTMSVRALESGVKKYYEDITGNSSDGKTFGQMTNELRDSSSADEKLVGYMDYLKDIRNDLAHPNKRIGQFEAEQAFQHTVEILSTVYK